VSRPKQEVSVLEMLLSNTDKKNSLEGRLTRRCTSVAIGRAASSFTTVRRYCGAYVFNGKILGC
jgi:hypothetical protein